MITRMMGGLFHFATPKKSVIDNSLGERNDGFWHAVVPRHFGLEFCWQSPPRFACGT
jgi:hypothetical protein